MFFESGDYLCGTQANIITNGEHTLLKTASGDALTVSYSITVIRGMGNFADWSSNHLPWHHGHQRKNKYHWRTRGGTGKENTELERLNKYFLNREAKIMELKKENEELKKNK